MSTLREPDAQESAGRPGFLTRMRALPGFVPAIVAFFVVILLGAGVPLAAAKWQQTATATMNITVGAVEGPPPGSGAARVVDGAHLKPRPVGPGRKSAQCVVGKTKAELANRDKVDVTFSWSRASSFTHYTVTLTSDDPRYNHAAEVKGESATFSMPRIPSDRLGNPLNGAGTKAPYYTQYSLRVQPMNGAIAGDAAYLAYEYQHSNVENCYYDAKQHPPLGPLTSVKHTVSAPASDRRYVSFSWNESAGATSYDVSLLAANGWGAETTVEATGADFELPFSQTGGGFFADYRVRIQPMNGTVAGDPVYKTLKYFSWGTTLHEAAPPE